MDVVYPPVGIAHITRQIPDLIADRMPTAREIRIACAMQPKAAPHFGTGIVILTAFALARLLRDTFGKPASVLLDMLDNAPAQTTVIDGIEYSLCLSHAIDSGRSMADINTEPVRQLAAWASRQAAISFRVRRYSEIQAQPDFRHGLSDVLSHPEMFVPLFSPSEHRLRIRPLCPRCGLIDKTGRTVQSAKAMGPPSRSSAEITAARQCTSRITRRSSTRTLQSAPCCDPCASPATATPRASRRSC